tara:strand:- start:179 stop:1363 length:1185 start_codon:yes stop_codon:yes gene_type:complete
MITPKILIIDWSMIAQSRTYSLLSGHEPLLRATDIEEVRYRMTRDVWQILDLVKPTMTIIAKDYKINGVRQYWRGPFLAEYHKKNTEKYISEAHEKVYYRFDNVIYPETNSFPVQLGKKLTKKEIPEDLQLVSHWDRDRIEDFAPTYKGNRVGDWVFETPKEEFTKLYNDLATDLSQIIPNCRVVEAPHAEADDIAGVLTCKAPNTEHVLVTGDGDWYQLVNDKVSVRNHITFDLLEEPMKKISNDLKIKLIGGDAKDNIKGTYTEGKMGCHAKGKPAQKIVAEGLQHTVNQASYERNKRLILLDLDNIPKFVQESVLTTLRGAKVNLNPELSWEKLGLNLKEQAILTKSGDIFGQKFERTPSHPSGASKEPEDTERTMEEIEADFNACFDPPF